MENLVLSVLQCLGADSLTNQKILSVICKHTGALAGKWIDHNEKTSAEWSDLHDESFPAAKILNLQLSNRMERNATLMLWYKTQDAHDKASVELEPLLNLLVFLEEKTRLEVLLRSLSGEVDNLANKNTELFQQLIANEKRMTSISRGIIRMQEEERAKISRELHDGIGQALLAMKIHLDLIEANPAEAREKVNEARTLAEQTLGEVRQLSRLLRPPMLDDLGLLPTLRAYVKSYVERTGILVSFTATGIEGRLDPDIETMFFRVTQEGLNNVLKHSEAQNVAVVVSASESRILYELSDNGKGYVINSPSELKGSGIRGIRDRVALLGGEFSIDSNPNLGTKLRIELPLKKRVIKGRAHLG